MRIPSTGSELVHRSILAVFAHPDDETFLAGGTLAKYAAAGHEVSIVCATFGELGRRGDFESLSRMEFAHMRRMEMEAACDALGVRRVEFLGCADQQLASECWNAATKEIVGFIRSLRPQVIVTFGPDGVSGHPDHIAISQIVTSAFWGAATPKAASERASFQASALYYVLRSGAVPACCHSHFEVKPPQLTTRIEIDEFGARKLAAIQHYGSQKHLHPKSSVELERVLHAEEHFHRAYPRFAEEELESCFYRMNGAMAPLRQVRSDEVG